MTDSAHEWIYDLVEDTCAGGNSLEPFPISAAGCWVGDVRRFHNSKENEIVPLRAGIIETTSTMNESTVYPGAEVLPESKLKNGTRP